MIGQSHGSGPFQTKHKEEDEGWLITYADFITLLMGFFVMMFSISKVDTVKLEQMQSGLARDIGSREIVQPIQMLKIDIKDIITSAKAEDVAGVTTDDEGVVLDLAAAGFYQPGSAEIRPEAEPLLKRVAGTLNAERYVAFQVEVGGHTDDSPISTQQFASNWELSALRAARVVRFFSENGITPVRMRAVGFAEVSPRVPNRDPQGNPLAANQAVNRRVTIRMTTRK